MDFGIALAPSPDAWRLVQRAERLGFHHAWFYDSQLLYADVFVAMTGAALHTSRIRLGTAVAIPSNRIAPVTANALAALNAMAPGRIDFGVGTGFTGRRTMGLGAIPLARLREYLRVVRGLWAGETIDWEFEGERRKIRFLNPETGALNLDDPIPVHLSAFGPRSRRLCAEIADGWMTFAFGVAAALADAEAVVEACRARGRDPRTLYRTAFTLGCVLAEGEDPGGPRARAQAGPLAAALLHSLVESDERIVRIELPPELKAAVEAYRHVSQSYEPSDARYLTLHRGHLLYLRPEEEAFIGGDFLRAATLTGTPDDLCERIRALRDGGYQQLVVQIVPGHEDALEQWADVMQQV